MVPGVVFRSFVWSAQNIGTSVPSAFAVKTRFLALPSSEVVNELPEYFLVFSVIVAGISVSVPVSAYAAGVMMPIDITTASNMERIRLTLF